MLLVVILFRILNFRSLVGALQYATVTRPEISFAVSKVSQFMHNPLESHWKTVKRILRYLKHTLDFGVHFRASLSLPNDPDDRRSPSGLCVYLGPNLVS